MYIYGTEVYTVHCTRIGLHDDILLKNLCKCGMTGIHHTPAAPYALAKH